MFRDFYARVHAYAARRVGSGSADDIAAEVFTVAWRRFDDLPDDPLPWLLTTARLTCLNELRGRRRADGAAARFAGELAVLQQAAETDHTVDPDLVRALGELSDTDRELILLVAWEDLSHRQIAEVLGTSATNVTLRLFRARRRIARLMKSGATTTDRHDMATAAKEARDEA